ncbi:dihydrolipoamide dehydrogenase E3 subunit of both pyruvate dehydrogenase and 2-oxoglutarate dehydrogenase complexes [Bacillus subtilis]|nr:dihydrolipoamide dehydrogenase E3 subunit of both pyruvate dehydrogenase and 2-oxoglutarate dehydrogenase complexes [Bacillus subtilis]
MGITAENVTVDFTKVQEWKASVVNKLTAVVAGLLKGNKVDVVKGEAYFVDSNSVRVMDENSAQTYTFKTQSLLLVLVLSNCQTSNIVSVS